MYKLMILCIFAACNLCQASEFLAKSFKSNFVQEFKSGASGKIKTSSGILFYQYPGSIRLEVTDPDDSLIYVSNPRKTWYYRPPFIEGEPGELSVSPKGNTLVAKFFDSLSSGLKSNKLYSVKMKNSDLYVLSFSKAKIKEIGIKDAALKFKDSKQLQFENLEYIDLTYKDKKKVRLKFSQMVANPKFDNKTFLFEVPANTNINSN